MSNNTNLTNLFCSQVLPLLQNLLTGMNYGTTDILTNDALYDRYVITPAWNLLPLPVRLIGRQRLCWDRFFLALRAEAFEVRDGKVVLRADLSSRMMGVVNRVFGSGGGAAAPAGATPDWVGQAAVGGGSPGGAVGYAAPPEVTSPGPDMTEARYFIRIRGKVTGPYSLMQLQALQQRGQFGRFHEVSEDRQVWQPAATLTNLFTGRSLAGGGPTQAAVNEPASRAAAGPPPGPAEWYYLDAHGGTQGPVSLQDLHGLLRTGAVTAATLACKPGMAEWVALQTLEGFGTPAPAPAPAPAYRPAAARPALAAPVAQAAPVDAGFAAGADLVEPIDAADPGWLRVRTALTLVLVAVFTWLGLGVLVLGGWLIALAQASEVPLAISFLVALGLALVNRVVEITGYSYALKVPVGVGTRGHAIAVLVLAIVSLVLTFVPLLLLPAFGVPETLGELWSAGTRFAIIAIIVATLVTLCDVVRLLLFQFYLGAVSLGLGDEEQARGLRFSRYFYLGALGGYLLAGLLLVGMVLSLPDPTPVRIFFFLFLLVDLAATGTLLFWFVRYLIALFHVRHLVGRGAGR